MSERQRNYRYRVEDSQGRVNTGQAPASSPEVAAAVVAGTLWAYCEIGGLEIAPLDVWVTDLETDQVTHCLCAPKVLVNVDVKVDVRVLAVNNQPVVGQE